MYAETEIARQWVVVDGKSAKRSAECRQQSAQSADTLWGRHWIGRCEHYLSAAMNWCSNTRGFGPKVTRRILVSTNSFIQRPRPAPAPASPYDRGSDRDSWTDHPNRYPSREQYKEWDHPPERRGQPPLSQSTSTTCPVCALLFKASRIRYWPRTNPNESSLFSPP